MYYHVKNSSGDILFRLAWNCNGVWVECTDVGSVKINVEGR